MSTRPTGWWTNKKKRWEKREGREREISSLQDTEKQIQIRGHFKPPSLDSRLPKWQVILRSQKKLARSKDRTYSSIKQLFIDVNSGQIWVLHNFRAYGVHLVVIWWAARVPVITGHQPAQSSCRTAFRGLHECDFRTFNPWGSQAT